MEVKLELLGHLDTGVLSLLLPWSKQTVTNKEIHELQEEVSTTQDCVSVGSWYSKPSSIFYPKVSLPVLHAVAVICPVPPSELIPALPSAKFSYRPFPFPGSISLIHNSCSSLSRRALNPTAWHFRRWPNETWQPPSQTHSSSCPGSLCMTRKKSPPVSWPGSVSSALQRYLSKTQTRPHRSPAENPLMVRKLKLLGQQHMGEGSSESMPAHFPHPVDQIRSWFPPRARLALEAFPCLCTSHVRTPVTCPPSLGSFPLVHGLSATREASSPACLTMSPQSAFKGWRNNERMILKGKEAEPGP